MAGNFATLPIIDIGALIKGVPGRLSVADQIARACRESGFFYIAGHGIDDHLQQRLEELSRTFFAWSLGEKLDIRMERGGSAWRGYFPVGGELTSGKPDLKEGLYFGAELDRDHPLVRSGTPMHGANLFPKDIAFFRETVLEYMGLAGEVEVRLGRCETDPWVVRLQHRGYARPNDRRALSLHAAPRPQSFPSRPAVFSVFL